MDILYSQQNHAGLPANLAVAVTLAASMLSPLSAEEQEGTSYTEAIPAYRDCITASCAAPTPEGKIEATTQLQPAATPAAPPHLPLAALAQKHPDVIMRSLVRSARCM